MEKREKGRNIDMNYLEKTIEGRKWRESNVAKGVKFQFLLLAKFTG